MHTVVFTADTVFPCIFTCFKTLLNLLPIFLIRYKEMRGSSSLLHSIVNVVRMQLNWNVPHFNIGGVFAIFAAVLKQKKHKSDTSPTAGFLFK